MSHNNWYWLPNGMKVVTGWFCGKFMDTDSCTWALPSQVIGWQKRLSCVSADHVFPLLEYYLCQQTKTAHLFAYIFWWIGSGSILNESDFFAAAHCVNTVWICLSVQDVSNEISWTNKFIRNNLLHKKRWLKREMKLLLLLLQIAISKLLGFDDRSINRKMEAIALHSMEGDKRADHRN